MKFIKYVLAIIITFSQFSCEDFVDVDVPDQKIVSETVFGNDQTAIRAVKGIYNELFKSDFSSGGFRSVTMLGSLSSGEFQTSTINDELIEFKENEITVDNSYNLGLWSSAYNIIYMCNSVIDGLDRYIGVSTEMKDKLKGEVQFIRAFTYFYLVNLYGEVPLIQSTDYQKNTLATRNGIEEIYKAIISDLENAISTLGSYYEDGERIHVNKITAMALLARVHLYLENWELAEKYSTEVINRKANFGLLSNLDEVFFANSKESIWQVSPAGRGTLSHVTNEASVFILTNPPPQSQQPIVLTDDVTSLFAENDIRYEHWIGVFHGENESYYYPYKYKINNSESIIEYSTLLRLAEQYLIRSEARTYQGKLTGGIADLDKIRERANLTLIAKLKPNIDKEDLLDSIQIERQRELFSEWGHRWLDLKRTRMASKVLSAKKEFWKDTDVLFPIPEQERSRNPNLTQNHGY